jgi:uncharacterized protein
MTLDVFFKNHPRIAVALSGGVDSSYLAWAAKNAGCDVTAYFVKSAFQPRFEAQDAAMLCNEHNIPYRVIDVDILSDNTVTANPSDRCYHCKRAIFDTIIQNAHIDGYPVVVEGTNASDDAADRPGMRALTELGVLSPLRECGLTKSDIRAAAKSAGLFTWDKPSYACLATRIPTGERITAEKLARTEQAEGLMFGLGFTDFRVRTAGNTAKIQVNANQMEKIISNRSQILEGLGQLYDDVTLDLEARNE